MSDRAPITATYRLQLHAGFGFAAAQAAVPHLARLGVSHLYLSPILQAAPGSTHGYDVVDHTRVWEELGGEAGLVALAAETSRHGLGIVVDLVPNHMAVPTPLLLNKPLWATLRDGRDSPSATWFDIDWDLCDGRVGLPVLGDPLDDVLDRGELTLDELDGEPVVRYFEQVFPVRAGTGSGEVRDVLSRQHYVLAHWRDKDDVLGYRRFFDVDTLIGVRVELPDVFEATHAVPVDLYRRGVIDGFRVDHPDGLADPEGYLELLRDATDGAWVVVEKIIVGDERLPTEWAAAGTTGYDALRAVQSALAPATGDALDAIWGEVDGGRPGLAETEHAAKQQVIDELLQPEVRRLARRAVEAARATGRELAFDDAVPSLEGTLAEVDKYRAYIRLDHAVPEGAAADVRAWEAAASRRGDGAGSLDELLLASQSADPATRDLVVRFQQVCGPVMAKSVEDTTFYRWHRFDALNEVGGDPADLDHPGPERLHAWAAWQSRWHPSGMTTLSTHDTKRDEFVRARLLAAGEDVETWTALWHLVRAQARIAGVDEATAYLLMQTVVGAWPITAERLKEYATKAVREAKANTTWTEPDDDYEARVASLADDLLSDPVADTVATWVEELREATASVVITAKVLQLTLPGIPDVYQGCEVVQGRLVDPDNRQPVDFAATAARLEHLDGLDSAGRALLDLDGPLDDALLWVTATLLRFRRDRPGLLGGAGDYRALAFDSPHLVGFMRGDRVMVVGTRHPWTLRRRGNAPRIELPEGDWTDVLTGRRHRGGHVASTRLFGQFPAVVLVQGAS